MNRCISSTLCLISLLASVVLSTSVLEGARQFSVVSYGATVNNNSNDDRPGIQSAINAAISYINANNLAADVYFPPGNYHLKSSTESGYILKLGNKTKGKLLKFEGSNAKLIAKDQGTKGMFVVRNMSNVIFKKLKIDYSPVPWYEGTITSINTSAGTFNTSKHFGANPTAGWFKNSEDQWARILHGSALGRPKTGSKSAHWFHSVASIGNNNYRFKPKSGLSDFSVGDRIAYLSRGNHAFAINDCELVELKTITVYAAPGFLARPQNSEDLYFYRCKALIANGRWHSICGDGINFKDCDLVDINECVIKGNGDDAFNANSSTNWVIRNSRAENKRRHGVLVKAGSNHGTIRDCVFKFNGGQAIVIESGAGGDIDKFDNQSSNNGLNSSL